MVANTLCKGAHQQHLVLVPHPPFTSRALMMKVCCAWGNLFRMVSISNGVGESLMVCNGLWSRMQKGGQQRSAPRSPPKAQCGVKMNGCQHLVQANTPTTPGFSNESSQSATRAAGASSCQTCKHSFLAVFQLVDVPSRKQHGKAFISPAKPELTATVPTQGKTKPTPPAQSQMDSILNGLKSRMVSGYL